MQIFVYEHVCARGRQGGDHERLAALLPEAKAMLSAAIADFSALDDCRVSTILAQGLALDLPGSCVVKTARGDSEANSFFDKLAATSDATLLIAPESDGVLLECARRALAAGGRLLGPSPEFIQLTADKHATCLALSKQSVSAPDGVLVPADGRLPQEFRYPAVLKPRFGEGAQGTCTIHHAQVNSGWAGHRLEPVMAGITASVLLICGPRARVPLPACRQIQADDGSFAYMGGAYPLSPELAQRAERLALAAIAALPQALGYVGVDLVLGTQADGTRDVVIEVNPRLTTSYVGLRRRARTNLPRCMLDVSAGRAAPVEFDRTPLYFSARYLARPALGCNSAVE